jgi:hypothetical protein
MATIVAMLTLRGRTAAGVPVKPAITAAHPTQPGLAQPLLSTSCG